MSALKFNVVHEDAGDGWVYAHVPELPEVQTQGEDLERTRSIELMTGDDERDRRRRGHRVPGP